MYADIHLELTFGHCMRIITYYKASTCGRYRWHLDSRHRHVADACIDPREGHQPADPDTTRCGGGLREQPRRQAACLRYSSRYVTLNLNGRPWIDFVTPCNTVRIICSFDSNFKRSWRLNFRDKNRIILDVHPWYGEAGFGERQVSCTGFKW